MQKTGTILLTAKARADSSGLEGAIYDSTQFLQLGSAVRKSLF
jgi:hypothetical protein